MLLIPVGAAALVVPKLLGELFQLLTDALFGLAYRQLRADEVMRGWYVAVTEAAGWQDPLLRWVPAIAAAAAVCCFAVLVLSAAVTWRARALGWLRIGFLGVASWFIVAYAVTGLPWTTLVLSTGSGGEISYIDTPMGPGPGPSDVATAGSSPLLTPGDRMVGFGLPTLCILLLALVIFLPYAARLGPSRLAEPWWGSPAGDDEEVAPSRRLRAPAAPLTIAVIAVPLLANLPGLWTIYPWQIAWLLGIVALLLLPWASWLVFSGRGRATWRFRSRVNPEVLGEVLEGMAG